MNNHTVNITCGTQKVIASGSIITTDDDVVIEVVEKRFLFKNMSRFYHLKFIAVDESGLVGMTIHNDEIHIKLVDYCRSMLFDIENNMHYIYFQIGFTKDVNGSVIKCINYTIYI